MSDDILRFFVLADSPPVIKNVVLPFYELAFWMTTVLPDNPDRAVFMEKLLEAKDAAVRCVSGESDKSNLEATIDAVRAVKLAAAAEVPVMEGIVEEVK